MSHRLNFRRLASRGLGKPKLAATPGLSRATVLKQSGTSRPRLGPVRASRRRADTSQWRNSLVLSALGGATLLSGAYSCYGTVSSEGLSTFEGAVPLEEVVDSLTLDPPKNCDEVLPYLLAIAKAHFGTIQVAPAFSYPSFQHAIITGLSQPESRPMLEHLFQDVTVTLQRAASHEPSRISLVTSRSCLDILGYHVAPILPEIFQSAAGNINAPNTPRNPAVLIMISDADTLLLFMACWDTGSRPCFMSGILPTDVWIHRNSKVCQEVAEPEGSRCNEEFLGFLWRFLTAMQAQHTKEIQESREAILSRLTAARDVSSTWLAGASRTAFELDNGVAQLLLEETTQIINDMSKKLEMMKHIREQLSLERDLKVGELRSALQSRELQTLEASTRERSAFPTK